MIEFTAEDLAKKQEEEDAMAEEYENAVGYFTKSQVEGFEEAFKLFDLDGSGTIDAEELQCVFQSLGQNKNIVSVEEMILDFDSNENMEIDFDEFIVLMYRTIMEGSELGNAVIHAVQKNFYGLTIERALTEIVEQDKHRCVVLAVDAKTSVCFVESTIVNSQITQGVIFPEKETNFGDPKYCPFNQKTMTRIMQYVGVFDNCCAWQYVNHTFFIVANCEKIWQNFYLKLMKRLRRQTFGKIVPDYKSEYKKELFTYEWEDLVRTLPPKGCRLVLFNFKYTANIAHRSKYVFLHWSPPLAPVQEELMCTFALSGLKRTLLNKLFEDNVIFVRSCDTKDLNKENIRMKCLRDDQKNLVKRIERDKTKKKKTEPIVF